MRCMVENDIEEHMKCILKLEDGRKLLLKAISLFQKGKIEECEQTSEDAAVLLFSGGESGLSAFSDGLKYRFVAHDTTIDKTLQEVIELLDKRISDRKYIVDSVLRRKITEDAVAQKKEVEKEIADLKARKKK